MGRAIPLTIHGKFFEKKEDLTEFVRALIARYPVGTFLAADDHAFCIALFKHHSDAGAKFGPGISNIEVRLDIYGKKHFQVHRVDGSDDDISWPHCIKNAKGET